MANPRNSFRAPIHSTASCLIKWPSSDSRTAARNPSNSGRSPSAINSTPPSAKFRTVPVTSNPVASRFTVYRNPTPCTRPEYIIFKRFRGILRLPFFVARQGLVPSRKRRPQRDSLVQDVAITEPIKATILFFPVLFTPKTAPPPHAPRLNAARLPVGPKWPLTNARTPVIAQACTRGPEAAAGFAPPSP